MNNSKLTQEEIEQLLHDRSFFELWLDKHNHFMSFLRTIASVNAALISVIILYKVL